MSGRTRTCASDKQSNILQKVFQSRIFHSRCYVACGCFHSVDADLQSRGHTQHAAHKHGLQPAAVHSQRKSGAALDSDNERMARHGLSDDNLPRRFAGDKSRALRSGGNGSRKRVEKIQGYNTSRT